jgi:hypothetical protein
MYSFLYLGSQKLDTIKCTNTTIIIEIENLNTELI